MQAEVEARIGSRMESRENLPRERRISEFPFEERLRLLEKAWQLRKEGLGPKRIAKLLGLKRSTTNDGFVAEKDPMVLPNLNPSPELAYIICASYRDVCIHRGKNGN